MATFGVLASEGRRVPSNLTKFKQRTLFEFYGKKTSQEKNYRSKETTNQMLNKIFGSLSVCEDHDDDIKMEESGNILQADIELPGMPLDNPPPAQTKYDALKKVLAEIGLDVHDMIHDIRWLSRGKVMERLVALMPAILTFWKEGDPAWYKKLCIYKVLFIIHLLADVLYDLNVLSKHFQEEDVDIACISAYIEVTMASLRRKFLEEDFGKGTKYPKQFMADVETGSWIYTNESGEVYIP
ncbi:hypothetical protein L7F22_069095 [Adiantum nelumboides]|nr:hypothetical protein [Adiantum nelumboides]